MLHFHLFGILQIYADQCLGAGEQKADSWDILEGAEATKKIIGSRSQSR